MGLDPMAPEWTGLVVPLALLAGAGLIAGFLSGLLGIGGGFIVVPALYLLAGPLGIEPGVAMHMALGTSLAAMIATTARAARAHDRKGAVDWIVLRRLGPYVVGGSALGAALAGQVRGPILTAIFATTALGLSVRTAWGDEPGPAPPRPLARAPEALAALAIGFASAVVGIGGAAFGAPLLRRLGFSFHRVIGTAAFIGVLVAAPGAVLYALSGIGVPGRPPWSIGFVNLPGCLLILATTPIAVSPGVALNHRLSPVALRRVFALFLALTAARMIASLI